MHELQVQHAPAVCSVFVLSCSFPFPFPFLQFPSEKHALCVMAVRVQALILARTLLCAAKQEHVNH